MIQIFREGRGLFKFCTFKIALLELLLIDCNWCYYIYLKVAINLWVFKGKRWNPTIEAIFGTLHQSQKFTWTVFMRINKTQLAIFENWKSFRTSHNGGLRLNKEKFAPAAWKAIVSWAKIVYKKYDVSEDPKVITIGNYFSFREISHTSDAVNFQK